MTELPTRQTTTVDALPSTPETVISERAVVVRARVGAREIRCDLAHGQSLLVGRSPDADLYLEAPGVSRSHCRIVRDDAGVRVEDLGSRNGVFVRGVRAQAAFLVFDETFYVGNTQVWIEGPADLETQPLAEVCPDFDSDTFVGQGLRDVFALIERLAPSTVPVLVCGETGVGKEVVVRALHRKSPRAEGPFVALSCAAIAPSLTEAALFGQEEGAFTGATDKDGAFVSAHGGTLFLDEVGELNASAQAALLRVLETGRCAPVGSHCERDVDVRLVTATHRDLEAMVEEGTFRLDLLHRLNTVVVTVPPLRKREHDILPLAELLLRQLTREEDCPVPRLEDDVCEVLQNHDWPGNVRELRNCMHRALAVCDRRHITLADLPETVVAGRSSRRRDDESDDARQRRRAAEIRRMRLALARTNGNRQQAAQLLGVSERTLYLWLRSG